MDLIQIAKEILAGNQEPSEDILVEILTFASDQYYNDGESFLSDAEYDSLEQMLKSINPKNLFLASVGSDVRGGKINLPYTMGSLDQVYEGDTIRWIVANGWEDELFVLSDKEDGTSALNVYSKKKLSIAYSRGNGFQGADITRHMSRIKACPQAGDSNCAIRLEVIMEDHEFNDQMAIAQAAGERVYKNPRNYVAGRMNASESPQQFYDTVRVIGTSVVEPKMGKLDQMKFMEGMGFEVPHYIVKKGRELTDEFLIAYLNERREKSKTAIDGIVIDLDNPEIRATLRRNSSSINPMYSRKFKVGGEDNVAITEVVKVHYEPSKLGYLKPRVEIVPVDLVGVTITYATGFNAKFIRDNGVGPGAKIQITRSGDVIPFIQRIVEAVDPQLPTEAEFGEMEWTEGDVDLVLTDLDSNDTVQLNRLIDTFKGLDVPFLREGTLEKLYQAGYKTAASIIVAPEADIAKVCGDSAAGKIAAGLKAKLMGVEMGILAGSSQMFGRGIGRRKMTRLLEAFPDRDLFSLTVKEIVSVEGFEAKTAKKVYDNMPKFTAFLKEIDGFYSIAAPKAKVVGGDLDGVIVVFTGIRDKELEAKIEARGGSIGSSVNAKTSFLVAKDPSGNSSKLVKARQLIGEDNVISISDALKRWG